MPATILLVDDNPVQAATRKAILTYSGHSIVMASDAYYALELLRGADLAQSIKLIITDHCMPGMSGPQFVATLRQLFPLLPILVLSGLPDVENEYSGMNIVYRVKPIAPQDLIQLAQSFCGDALGRTA